LKDCFRLLVPYFIVSLIVILISCQLYKTRLFSSPLSGPYFRARDIFLPVKHGQECHASTIIELDNGDLLATWWSGPYEGARDVVIKISRLRFGRDSWEVAKTVVDIPDRFEGTPVLFSFPDNRVWLFFNLIDPDSKLNAQTMFRQSLDRGYTWGPIEELITRRGLRTRNHPLIMTNGEVLLPLFDRISYQSIFLITGDSGKTWEMGGSIASDTGNIEPTVISRSNGHLYALMRSWDDDPAKRFLWQSESRDYGRTWAMASYSSVPSVSSASEMIKLRNGHVVLAFNNGKGRRRTPLSVALSSDEGLTWQHIRDMESGEGSFSYPSLVQTRDGLIHVTYSYNRQFIKHVELNEQWIKAKN